MSISKPFHRNFRGIKDAPNSGYSSWAYIVDHDYAQHPQHYIRAFQIIQNDIINLFETIEPADVNSSTYSLRIHGLLMRICIEVEANFKAILKENIYNPLTKSGKPKLEKNWNIFDFKIVNLTHHLDEYLIEIPIWTGQNKIRQPFSGWKTSDFLPWYTAYNECKHDRFVNFGKANLGNLMDAYCGLFALLSSQFKTESFSTGGIGISAGAVGFYKGEFGIGEYLMVTFPDNWAEDDMYDFDWSILSKEKDRFQKIDYNQLLNS